EADDGRPLFLFVQTYRVHWPYVDGSPAQEEAPTAGTEAEALLAAFAKEAPRLEHAQIHAHHPSDSLRAGARSLPALYDAGVQELDRERGAVAAELRGRRFLDRSYLLFTSDHGEAFLEHGGLQHSLPPHEEQVRVPLVLLGPGVPVARSDRSVSLLDVTPTLAALAGLERDESWSGRSLLLAPDQPGDRLLF